MNSPGIYSLGDVTITTAATYVGTLSTSTPPVQTGLDGMTGATVELRLAYGSGGTSGVAYVQTSLDEGTTWVDIASMAFTTASKSRVWNFSGLTPRTTAYTPTDGALADDTAVDGMLGDRLRLKIVTTGTYAGNTILTGRFAAR